MYFGCVGQNNVQNNEKITPRVVEYGDNVSVNYVLVVDGKVVDTNIESVARENAIYSPFGNYRPLTFKVLLGQKELLPAFVKATVGMKINETKQVVISPRDGYGEYNDSLVYNVSRYYNKSFYEKIPLSYFKSKNITVENGTSFDTEIGKVFIVDYDNESATIMYLFQVGDSFDLNGFHQVVVAIANETYTIMFDVRENGTYKTISPKTGQPVRLRVTKLENDTFTVDENHPLAGKTLYFNITVVDIQ
jgi:FKBP-type peptidyl-prolyl cis-trans isomerase 2